MRIGLLFLAVGLLCSCHHKVNTGVDDTFDAVQATAWVQSAAEYRALTRQVYQTAAHQLETLKNDPTHSAIDGVDLSGKPPAVILDIDETVLDNSPYQVELMREGLTFSKDTWFVWVRMAKAEAIPGVKEFLLHAQDMGVDIFYISNRMDENIEPTIRNLKDLGLPVKDASHVLLKTTTSNKDERRSRVTQTHRVIMLFGDALGDFDGTYDQGPREHRWSETLRHQAHFGHDWFVLPNPVYGKWERVLPKKNEEQSSRTTKMDAMTGYQKQ